MDDRASQRRPASTVLRELDQRVSAYPGDSVTRNELESIVAGLHQLESVTRTPIIDVLGILTDTFAPAPAQPASQILTSSQEAALREAGSFVDHMPSAEHRASVEAARRLVDLIADSLTLADAAEQLGVPPSQVRHRIAARTLVAIKPGTAYRLPQFQFTGRGELPGWKQLVQTFPPTVHVLSINWFMTTPHRDLSVANGILSPVQWLNEGNDTERIARMIKTAFHVDSA